MNNIWIEYGEFRTLDGPSSDSGGPLPYFPPSERVAMGRKMARAKEEEKDVRHRHKHACGKISFRDSSDFSDFPDFRDLLISRFLIDFCFYSKHFSLVLGFVL